MIFGLAGLILIRPGFLSHSVGSRFLIRQSNLTMRLGQYDWSHSAHLLILGVFSKPFICENPSVIFGQFGSMESTSTFCLSTSVEWDWSWFNGSSGLRGRDGGMGGGVWSYSSIFNMFIPILFCCWIKTSIRRWRTIFH